MHIRQFTATDTQAVVDLWQACGLLVPWNNPYKDIERKLSVGPELFLVGTVNEVIVSTVMGGYDGHRGTVNYLAVDTAHRNKGYARQLMQTVEKQLQKLGCPKLNLQVRSGNTSVLDFYAALGYTEDKVVSLGKRLIADA